MRVLVVHYHLKDFYGGAEEVITQLSRYLVNQGVEVKVVMESHPFAMYREVREWIGWADVVNVHNFPSGLTIFPYCSKPVVWICNEPPELFTRWWKKPAEALNRYLMRNKYVIVGSNYDAVRFGTIYRRNPNAIIPYGVDYNYFSEGKDNRRDEVFKVLQVGCIGRYKNQLESVLVLSKLKDLIPKAKLILAGPKVNAGTGLIYWKAVEDAIRVYGLEDDVIMTGALNKERVRDLYYSCDVLLHPILEQGGYLVVLEALSAGLPVVVSEQFLGRDMVRDYGVITNDYVNVLHALWKNPEGYREQAGKGSKWIKDNLTWDIYGEKVLKVFEEVDALK